MLVGETHHKCFLCGEKEAENIHRGTRDKPNLDVLRCNSCGLVFLSDFEHIRGGLYEQSEMHQGELNIEALLRETETDEIRRFECLKDILKDKSVLDFGCGYGGFCRRARQVAHTITGVELEEQARNYVSKDANAFSQIEDCGEMRFDVITLFHVLEHLEDPVLYLAKFASHLFENGEVIIEIPNADDALLTLYNSRAFADFAYWSCHLFLYNELTLTKLMDKANYRINWMKQVQRYPLSNHLYWLAKGKPGGHKVWS